MGNICLGLEPGQTRPPSNFDTVKGRKYDEYAKFTEDQYYPTHLIVVKDNSPDSETLADELGALSLKGNSPREAIYSTYSTYFTLMSFTLSP